MIRYTNNKINIDEKDIVIDEVYYNINKTLTIRHFNYYHIFKNVSKHKFNEIFRRAIPKFRYHAEWYQFRYDVFKMMYDVKNTPKSWRNVLPDDIVLWFDNEFEKLSEQYEYMDNRRVALNKKNAQVRRYKNLKERGCCGSYDEIIICPIDNQEYRIGFNYGH